MTQHLPEHTPEDHAIDMIHRQISDAVGGAVSRLHSQIEAAAADLPDPPEGYRWVLHYGPARLADTELVANTVGVEMSAEFRLEEATDVE